MCASTGAHPGLGKQDQREVAFVGIFHDQEARDPVADTLFFVTHSQEFA